MHPEEVQIITVEDIREFTRRLTADKPPTLPEIGNFLKSVGKKLEGTHRHNISPGLLPATEQLVLTLQKLVSESRIKIDPDTKRMFYKKIVGNIQVLTVTAESKDPSQDFYSDIPLFGMDMFEVASYLATFIPVVTTASVLLN